MKNEHDLAYDRISREDIAKNTARYLSVEYDKVLAYLEANDPTEADRLKADNKTLKFKELKNTDFKSFTDDQLTQFLNTAGNHSKNFMAVKTKISEQQFADRLGDLENKN